MALDFTSLLLRLIAVIAFTTAYPMYTPKRYRWSPYAMPLYPARAYAPYYESYPQEVSEVIDIYPQDPYEKFRYYQIPYYFPEPAPYYYDEEEPSDDEDEKLEPYQEWSNQDSNAEANAIFLQNLILAQLYKDDLARENSARYGVTYGYPKEDYDDYVYGEPVKEVKQDEDVTQLKSLVKDSPKRQQSKNKPIKSRFTNNKWTPSEKKKRGNKDGQEEVVMPRPANPPRPAFHQRSHEPSVYDAIKKLLNDHSQDQKFTHESRQPKKRSYIPNEDALVEQLGSLKKSD